MRGALVIAFGDGDGFDILSGGTTTTLFGVRSRATMRRVVAALRRSQAVRGADPVPLVDPARLVRYDRRVLRAMRSFGSRRRPACER